MATAPASSPFTAKQIHLLSHLQQQFDFPFEVWRAEGDFLFPAGDFGGVDNNPGERAEVLQAARETGAACVASSGSGHALAVPLTGGGSELIAVADFSGDDPQRMQRHANLVIAAADLRETVVGLTDEAEALVEQVTENFEELSLFRSLAKHVELPESSTSPLATARNLLEELSPVCDAEGFALILRDESDDATSHAIHWAGDEFLSQWECHYLISSFREAASERPVVRNDIAASAHGEVVERLRELILVEIVSHGRLFGWLAACNRVYASPMFGRGGFTTVQSSLLVTSASMLGANIRNLELLQQKEALFTEMVGALVDALDARDPYTCGHSERVALFSRRMGAELGLTEQDRERIYLSGLLHDLGKIAVPDALLQKPSRLTEEEFATLAKHPMSGWSILQDVPAMRHILPGVLYHHECFDGGGYPEQLSGEAIPLDGRIIAVCDAYDAMTSDRPYRPGMAHEKALHILRKGAGQQWDPQIVAAFFCCIADILDIRARHRQRPLSGLEIR